MAHYGGLFFTPIETVADDWRDTIPFLSEREKSLHVSPNIGKIRKEKKIAIFKCLQGVKTSALKSHNSRSFGALS